MPNVNAYKGGHTTRHSPTDRRPHPLIAKKTARWLGRRRGSAMPPAGQVADAEHGSTHGARVSCRPREGSVRGETSGRAGKRWKRKTAAVAAEAATAASENFSKD